MTDHSKYGWTATYRIGKAITSKFNLEEVLSLIAKIACAVIKSDASVIVIANSGISGLYVAGSFGLNRDLVAKSGPLRFEKTVTGALEAAKKAIIIDDVSSSPRFKTPSLFKYDGAFSALCVPAVFNNRFLASLIFYSNRPAAYSKSQIKISSALAYQIALVIQNYNLYSNMHLNYFNTIKSLVLAMEAKDPYTKGHSERVTKYALLIASNMDLHPQQVQMIKYCGMLHDLGKIAISDNILKKPGSLTPDERRQIERHPAHGAEVLSPLAFLKEGISLVKHHHERFDGTGYPDRLKADKIPVTARILACADAYDAMTSDRPYRPRLTREQALQELRTNSGTQFDPEITDIFLKSLESVQ